ncbi:hypothetical protein AVEN_260285-1 [Araneus ventricosus]|uniref:Uncharacterized protein n=1 Tax=Araneus ventricosus TaxID=182803 RepID=A0A4Y2JJV1_ARAVE|nr:hypothetical protein AVEN_260285-1 [Araneus ventricosus]
MIPERYLLLKELLALMKHCKNALAKVGALIASQSAYFRNLQAYIALPEDSKFKEYADKLKYDIDRFLNSVRLTALHIYHEVQSIADLIKNIRSLSVVQLRILKRQMEALIDLLSQLLQITT